MNNTVDLSGCTILIVDDIKSNINMLMHALGDDYRFVDANDGPTAITQALEHNPDLILLDIVMPGMDGFEVCHKLKSLPQVSRVPVIFLTSLTDEKEEERGLLAGAVDFIIKPFSTALIRARVRNQLELKKHRDSLEEIIRQRTNENLMIKQVTIETLATLTEYRDPETGSHIIRTKEYIKALAKQLASHPRFQAYLTDEMIEHIYMSAPLHDIGKVGVPDSILFKRGKLTKEEFTEMKKHPQIGHDALLKAEKKYGEYSFLQVAKEIAYTHHERWDGKGYPRGLRGNEIPISGRLMALVDVYDALISKRVYKDAYPASKAIAIIKAGRGTQFDSDIVDAFLVLQQEFNQIALAHLDDEKELRAPSPANFY